MEKVSNVYKGGFFKNRHRLSWRAPIVGQALIDTFNLPVNSHIIDVGCAIGDYVKWLNENGMKANGIEGSQAAQEFFVTSSIIVHDLRTPLELGLAQFKYDLAFSLEVAEHIEPEYTHQYIENLKELSNTILISAASPGQKGHGHVNCKPRSYWIDMFKEHGFVNVKGYEITWKGLLFPLRNRKELSSYIRNVLVFERVGTNE